MSETQSVCKWCSQAIHLSTTVDIPELIWISPDGAVFCPKFAKPTSHEPVAEPASTGDPAARPSGPSAPQTSAEPCPICGSTKSPHAVGLSCHIPTPIREINEFPAAPHPVPRADGPEHPIVGPEDGSPCCEHCAKHPGSQWTLKVSQPVSGDAPAQPKELMEEWWRQQYLNLLAFMKQNRAGDAPEVDEAQPTPELLYLLQAADDVLAEQSRLNQKFTDKHNDLFTALMPWRDVNGKFEAAQISVDATKVEEIAWRIVDSSAEWFWGSALPESDAKEQVAAILRPYFPPASQKSTERLAEMKYQDLYTWKKKKFPDDPWLTWDELAPAERQRKIEEAQWYLNVLATPASTAPQIDWQKWYQKTADFVGGIRKELGLPDGDTHAIDHLIVIRDFLKKSGLIPPQPAQRGNRRG